ncbi:shikimate dehydrogenase [Glaciihabitans tibetensis]|uniref:Shikimate dehydrogenase n=1 Tax=Glaciihabitans tibetensis TaxID=1266600 RepID=A0A2T0VJG2_9MICO|nr:shikimate dehydrogenase [Glaciihabitans tibetensis]PRY70366.1 shikimate dehydrogenase [Glaciihabitans tibetensis]
MTDSADARQQLAVLGSPIGHSKSPALHAAAYRALGLDWHYDAVEVTVDALPEFVRSRPAQWRGLSLTMPLKRSVLPLLDSRDAIVNLAGGANTVLFSPEGDTRAIRGFNTDVYGVRAALETNGVNKLGYIYLLGGGATAASALIASSQLGADRALIVVRTPLKALELAQLGRHLGMDVTVQAFSDDAADRPKGVPDAVISTLPGGISLEAELFSDRMRARSVLLDVAYDPWPSALATEWQAAKGTVISGLEMLVHQAIAQVRIFVAGDASTPLPDESLVLKSMRAALTP